MVNKLKVKDKQYARLGIRKNTNGDLEYIDPSEKNKSKYEPIKKYTRP
ncbi:hypothetical protein CPJCM30710_30720 [Clostridium polyendosporum]|uniref:Uncharacterized protein n=1 Tax=Clostridium polyendosporum TaxID=69208 RepID=A0A919VI50_9CLOT|nr:hypothetical protein [Clostridium polyendosporum]GIM30406.1 hypothetical protein CPJCM30710_30720 [Clostridium polyendosporum]